MYKVYPWSLGWNLMGEATLQEFMTPDNINAVLERSRLPHEFGVLSIDIGRSI